MSQAIGIEACQEDETPTGTYHSLNHVQRKTLSAFIVIRKGTTKINVKSWKSI